MISLIALVISVSINVYIVLSLRDSWLYPVRLPRSWFERYWERLEWGNIVCADRRPDNKDYENEYFTNKVLWFHKKMCNTHQKEMEITYDLYIKNESEWELIQTYGDDHPPFKKYNPNP